MDDEEATLKYRRIFAAVREDDEEGFISICGDGEEATCDINYLDGTGNTVLHYAASLPSPAVLELILGYADCDVDPLNRMEKATPLHLAVKIPDPNLRLHIVESLLEAGADTKIRDKRGSLAIDLVPPGDEETKAAIRRSQGVAQLSRADVVHESDDEPGSDSEPSDDD